MAEFLGGVFEIVNYDHIVWDENGMCDLRASGIILRKFSSVPLVVKPEWERLGMPGSLRFFWRRMPTWQGMQLHKTFRPVDGLTIRRSDLFVEVDELREYKKTLGLTTNENPPIEIAWGSQLKFDAVEKCLEFSPESSPVRLESVLQNGNLFACIHIDFTGFADADLFTPDQEESGSEVIGQNKQLKHETLEEHFERRKSDHPTYGEIAKELKTNFPELTFKRLGQILFNDSHHGFTDDTKTKNAERLVKGDAIKLSKERI